MSKPVLSIVLAALVVAPVLGNSNVVVRRAAVGGGGGLDDDFSTNPFSGNWVKDYGGTKWSWDGAKVDWSHEWATDIIRNATTTTTSNQYAKVTYTIGTPASYAQAGVIVRSGATAGSDKYAFTVQLPENRITWWKVAGQTNTQLTYSQSCGTWSSTDTLGVSVSGTGASTVVKVWDNPSGAYSSWGVETCTLSYDCTLASTCVDSGLYVGIVTDGGGGASAESFDDFLAGDI